MAETTKKENATTKTAQASERPQAKRKRFSLNQTLHDKDYEWYFPSRQKDEKVFLVVRKHWWFLVQPALPFIGSIALLFIALWASTILGGDPMLWVVVHVVIIALIIGTGIWFAYKDLVVWWSESYIITDKRIVHTSGLLHPALKDIGMDKVQQVGINLKDMKGLFLRYGTLHLYLAGGDFEMTEVPNPRHVRDVITGISEGIKSKKAPEAPLPTPQDTTMASVLKDLSQGKDPPKLENADEAYPPSNDPEHMRGPRRPFGFFRQRSGIHYTSGEYTVKYIQRSRYVLWRNLSLPAILLLAVLGVAVGVPSMNPASNMLVAFQYWWIFMAIIVLILAGWMALLYLDYSDDVYILSNRRIIYIDRNYFNLARLTQPGLPLESLLEVEYKNIKDKRVQVPNVLQYFLHIGNVYVETPGKNPNIIFQTVDRPFEVLDDINRITGHKAKEDQVKKDNDEKKNLYRWFSSVVVALEQRAIEKGAPNLCNKDVISAIAEARALGLEVTIRGEEEMSDPNVQPGHVIHQNPPPGTLMKQGTHIEVVLSKKPSMVN